MGNPRPITHHGSCFETPVEIEPSATDCRAGAKGVHAATQELLEIRKKHAEDRNPVLSPVQEAERLLAKMTAKDDPKTFLHTFECIAVHEGWPKRAWAWLVAPYLTGDAQLAYYSLPVESADNYDLLKEEILGCYGLSPRIAAADFHKWGYKPNIAPRTQNLENLVRITHRWLQPERKTASKIVERVAIDKFVRALPPEEWKAVGMQNPENPKELVKALECALSTLSLEGNTGRHQPRQVHAHRDWNSDRQERRASRADTGVFPPKDEHMPSDLGAGLAAQFRKPWLAGCTMHATTQPRSPTLSVKLDGKITEALLDSGSNVTLARPSVIARGTKRIETIPVACVHGDVHEVPTVRVRVANGEGLL
ncbi:uncharacterized protein LOC124398110 isoform X2 [Silurus meridionalis]|uniref:uncharacterized protein LOC124398110 isoform X2 n=1 Tax=Silurus meridionalis TaxID=175797 RepID=UPI001EEC1FAF|nr:uncharacterized protein LOC124398110 isoform X2 [Silurus meridionalis]